MPSITLSNLSWSTPDARAVLSGLSLNFGSERTGLVGRNGTGKTTLLKLIAGSMQPQSGSVSTDGTVSLLRQSLQIDSGSTVADLFGAADAVALLRRAEAGTASIEEIGDTDWTIEERITSALARVGLEAEPETSLASFSGGQRTRAALAGAVFAEPDFLLLDEPTNNLDREGRDAVISLMRHWRGGAIVVSHDRELLEEMDAIVELTTLGATRYGGNWSAYRALKAQELEAAERGLADAERHAASVKRAAQEAIERKARRDSAGKKKGAKGDMPHILAGTRKDRAEDTGGGNARLADRRKTEADVALATARGRLEVLQPLTMTIASTGLPASRTVVMLDHVTAGYAPDIPLIRDLSFSITGPERVAIAGPNGSGKTTLLALVAGRLQPWQGTVRVVSEWALLDQQAALLDPTLSIRDNFKRINPEADENACRSALARFAFRADAALQTVATLSGGQMLRAGLACVIGGAKPPPLLILDEPTNHLDIDSIEAMEAGLRDYDGALLVVSHDEAFLDAIGIERRIEL